MKVASLLLLLSFSNPVLAASEDAALGIGFHSGQQTQAAAEWWEKNVPAVLYISNPPFNKPKKSEQDAIWQGLAQVTEIKKIDEPCFGERLRRNAAAIEAAGGQVKYGIDPFVLDKLAYSGPLFEALRSMGHDDIASKIESFVAALRKDAANIRSFEDWRVFLKTQTNVARSEDFNLDFNKYLLNFGKMTDEEILQINAMTYEYGGRTFTLRDAVVRWLTKAEFKPIGCLTDVGNLLAFVDKDLPEVVMMDAEVDDIGALTILRRAHTERGTKLRVVVQLPTDSAADGVAKGYQSLGYEVLRDPEAANLKAVLAAHK